MAYRQVHKHPSYEEERLERRGALAWCLVGACLVAWVFTIWFLIQFYYILRDLLVVLGGLSP